MSVATLHHEAEALEIEASLLRVRRKAGVA